MIKSSNCTWVVETDLHMDEIVVDENGKSISLLYEYAVYEAPLDSNGGVGHKSTWLNLVRSPVLCHATFNDEGMLQYVRDQFDVRDISQQREYVMKMMANFVNADKSSMLLNHHSDGVTDSIQSSSHTHTTTGSMTFDDTSRSSQSPTSLDGSATLATFPFTRGPFGGIKSHSVDIARHSAHPTDLYPATDPYQPPPPPLSMNPIQNYVEEELSLPHRVIRDQYIRSIHPYEPNAPYHDYGNDSYVPVHPPHPHTILSYPPMAVTRKDSPANPFPAGVDVLPSYRDAVSDGIYKNGSSSPSSKFSAYLDSIKQTDQRQLQRQLYEEQQQQKLRRQILLQQQLQHEMNFPDEAAPYMLPRHPSHLSAHPPQAHEFDEKLNLHRQLIMQHQHQDEFHQQRLQRQLLLQHQQHQHEIEQRQMHKHRLLMQLQQQQQQHHENEFYLRQLRHQHQMSQLQSSRDTSSSKSPRVEVPHDHELKPHGYIPVCPCVVDVHAVNFIMIYIYILSRLFSYLFSISIYA